MEKELHCIREASHYLPSVAFTAQDIRHIPTTNSTRWYQLWAQSQHAYSNKTIAEKTDGSPNEVLANHRDKA